MSINSRQDLIDYALRKLGAPVIRVEADSLQIEDRVDEALQFFQDFHYDATERVYLTHRITGTTVSVTDVSGYIIGETVISTSGVTFVIQEIDTTTNTFTCKTVHKAGVPTGEFVPMEVITGQTSGTATTVISKTAGDIELRSVPISDMVTGVIRAIPWWHVTNKSNYMFDPQYQVVVTNFQNIASSSMIYYSQLMSHIALIDQVLRPIDSLRFNRKTSRIYLDFDWTTAEIGAFLVFECYRILDPEVFSEIYNDRMLKKLVTAKIKYQVATNLQKFQGIQLLGGVTVDATTMMVQSVSEIEAIENEIRDSYMEYPVGFLG